MSLLERFETYVTSTLRIVLMAVGILAILAMAVLFTWAVWTVIAPNNVDHREFLTAPSYAELRQDLLPTYDITPSSQSRNGSQGVSSPYRDRLSAVVSTLDRQYNMAGRQEKKFSETFSAIHLERELIEEGLARNFNLQEVADDYLEALQSVATEIADDQVLSRIADTSSRTSIIIDAVNKFHDEYLLRLQDSFDFASILSSEQDTAETFTLQILLWSFIACFATFLMASLVLLVFRIESHLRKRNESLEVSVQ